MDERSLSGDGKPREECGIYGIHGCREAANFTYLGLYSLQHRGQESAGIVSTNGERLYRYAGMGQVAQVFNADKLSALVGSAAIGHNRYSTTGASFLRNAQPIRVESHLGSFALAHNGHLVNSWTVRKGPLVYGRRADGSHVFASETCAFDISEAQYVRDIKPGELVRVDSRGMTSFFPFERTGESLCIFENIYFSRPDSIIFGASVYEMRKNLGRMLARQCPTDADAIVAVPDSSTVAALGYAEESGIPFTIGLIRSHYIGRTFIEPEQRIRDFGAKIKYNVIASAVRDKRVVLVDDSIMRGTTSRKLIKMVRAAGAREVHLRISAPPTRHPCFYGIDIPTEGELIAAHHSVEEIESYLEVDSLGYLSLENAHEAMMNGRKRGWCDACFSGRYPVAVDDEKDGNQKDLFSEYLVEEIR